MKIHITIIFCLFSLTKTIAAPIVPPYTEDFESFPLGSGFCNAVNTLINDWFNETTDGADWLVDSGGTSSSNTGPRRDFNPGTNVGKYLYVESSNPCSPNRTAGLLTPAFDFTGMSQPRLDFWFHMLGIGMGDLHIDVSIDGGSTFDLDVIPAFTDDQNLWQQNTVDLSTYANEADVTIRFRGVTGISFSSDMAIDYVSVYELGTRNINVSVTGLISGNVVVLQNNGGDDLTVSADGNAAFTTALDDGLAYEVTVLTQPNAPNQVCTVANGSGYLVGVDITNITVTCAGGTHTVGGMVSGLIGSGLTLQNNGGDDLLIGADGSFTFNTALADLSNYTVTVSAQPNTPTQFCTVTNGSGQINGTNGTDVSIDCKTQEPEFTLSSTTIDFGAVNINTTESIVITVTNTGNADLEIIIATAPSAPFTLIGGGCLSLPIVPPGDTCEFEMTFSPMVTGNFNEVISITSNAATSPDEITISGSGVAGIPVSVPMLSKLNLLLMSLLLMWVVIIHRRHLN